MRVLFFIGFALLLVVTGCSRKVTSTATDTQVYDSTYVKMSPRFVPLSFPGKSVITFTRIVIDSTGKLSPLHIKEKSGGAFIDVTIKADGSIIAKGGCDSLKTVTELMDKEIFKLKHTVKNTVKTVTVTQYKTHGIDIFCRWYSGITLLVALLLIYLKFKKIIL